MASDTPAPAAEPTLGRKMTVDQIERMINDGIVFHLTHDGLVVLGKIKPTVAELQAILDDPTPMRVVTLPDGSIGAERVPQPEAEPSDEALIDLMVHADTSGRDRYSAGVTLLARLATKDAEITRLGDKSDAEMLRVKACEHIALGEGDWQKLRNECPSTAAVAGLRDAFEAAQGRIAELEAERNAPLPCEVVVAPSTLFGKGVPLRILLLGLSRRVGWDEQNLIVQDRKMREAAEAALADLVSRLQTALDARQWLLEGRGSFAWDDNDFRKEFAAAVGEVKHVIAQFKPMAADWSDCPTNQKEVEEARQAAADDAAVLDDMVRAWDAASGNPVNGRIREYAAKRAAVLAAMRPQEWRDIVKDPPPKDGTPIIYRDARGCVGEAFWNDRDEHEPAWWDESNTETVAPAYWMPLPAAPAPEVK